MKPSRKTHTEILICIFILVNSVDSSPVQSQEVYNLLNRIIPDLSSHFDIIIDARNVNTLDGNDRVKLVKSEANSIHSMYLHNYFNIHVCTANILAVLSTAFGSVTCATAVWLYSIQSMTVHS